MSKNRCFPRHFLSEHRNDNLVMFCKSYDAYIHTPNVVEAENASNNENGAILCWKIPENRGVFCLKSSNSNKKWRHFKCEHLYQFLTGSQEMYMLWRHFLAFLKGQTAQEAQ